MKKLLFSLLFFALLFSNATAQKVNPKFYDKAKHYQLKMMENGPWTYYPKWYYKTFHNKYRKRYQPNMPTRTKINGLALTESFQYKSQDAETENWKDRELELSADRVVDLALPTVSKRFEETQNIFLENMKTYTLLGGKNELKTGALLLEEYNRILDNKKIISQAHLENSKRQIAYNNALKDLDNLNETLAGYIKMMYNKKINQQFFKK